MLQVAEWKVGLRGEVLGREALPTLLPQWQDLCGRSAEDNVYYTPRYARALLDSVEQDKDLRFAVVRDQMRLVALLPFTRSKWPIPVLQPARQAWQTKYTFSCMPLLDRLRKDDAAGALLDVMASVSEGAWAIPTLNVDGEACRAIIAALGRRGLPWAFAGGFERAVLQPGGTFEEHMDGHVRPRRRKDLARNRRRLEKLGRVQHEAHSFGAGLDGAVAAFLEIEARGWKGRRGTALACDDKTRAFAVAAFTGAEGDSICRADMLLLDGAPIAVSLMVFAGRTGFTVKCTYDESYGSYSAGLLLEVEVIRSFLSENWAGRLDSATAGTHVLDGLWPGRIEVADLMFCLSPRNPDLRLSALRRSDRMRRSARAGLKRVVERIRVS